MKHINAGGRNRRRKAFKELDMDAKADLALYEILVSTCLQWHKDNGRADALNLLSSMMDMPGLPMHSPVHHFLVPAALLTACGKISKLNSETLGEELAIARERSLKLPGGMCGYLGCCGAAVGVGIFWSVITGATPLSETQWAYGLQGTGDALLAMAEAGGPRCCKRCSYIAILSATPQIKKILGLKLQNSIAVCRHNGLNNECIKSRCRFHPSRLAESKAVSWAMSFQGTADPTIVPVYRQDPAETQSTQIPIIVPNFCFPKKDMDNYCPCQDRPVALTGKKGFVSWLKEKGEHVECGQLVAELEVDMKTLMLPSPAEGRLVSQIIRNEDEFSFGNILGYLEVSHD